MIKGGLLDVGDLLDQGSKSGLNLFGKVGLAKLEQYLQEHETVKVLDFGSVQVQSGKSVTVKKLAMMVVKYDLRITGLSKDNFDYLNWYLINGLYLFDNLGEDEYRSWILEHVLFSHAEDLKILDNLHAENGLSLMPKLSICRNFKWVEKGIRFKYDVLKVGFTDPKYFIEGLRKQQDMWGVKTVLVSELDPDKLVFRLAGTAFERTYLRLLQEIMDSI